MSSYRKEQIAQLLYHELNHNYCHNCRCENCYRENMVKYCVNWEVSKEYCQELAELICKDN